MWLLACVPQVLEPTEVRQAGQITLSADATRGTARLRVLVYDNHVGPLPSERQGLALDACATQIPEAASAARVFRDAEVRAWCDGVEIALTEAAPGSWSRALDGAVPGTRCDVEIDGERLSVPPLPQPPDLEVRATRLTWTPAGADELRVSVPRGDGRSTLCRLRDDGAGPRPRGIGLQTAFVSRVELDAPKTEAGRVPIASIAGVWLPPGG